MRSRQAQERYPVQIRRWNADILGYHAQPVKHKGTSETEASFSYRRDLPPRIKNSSQQNTQLEKKMEKLELRKKSEVKTKRRHKAASGGMPREL